MVNIFCRAVVEAAAGEVVPAEVSGEEAQSAVVVRAASPVRVAAEEKEPEAPAAAAASPLDVVEVHDEPSVASQVNAHWTKIRVVVLQ